MKADGSALSVLVRFNTSEDGKVLIALYFEKKAPPQEAKKVDPRFSFLYGPGVVSRWKGPEVTVHLCGNSDYRTAAHRGVEKWSPILAERLTLRIRETETFPPFSDLNMNCIYFIKAFQDISETNTHANGVTAAVVSPRTHEIIGASIFVFEREYENARKEVEDDVKSKNLPLSSASDALKRVFGRTVTHEMGHFFGLDHKFDGTSSIMSYSSDRADDPTSYDKEAIQALYPFYGKK